MLKRDKETFPSAHVGLVQSPLQRLAGSRRVPEGNARRLYLRSWRGVSSAGRWGVGFVPGPKSPSSGSTSSSKMVSRGEGLGFTTTSGRFLGFLELRNHRNGSRLGLFMRARPAGAGGLV